MAVVLCARSAAADSGHAVAERASKVELSMAALLGYGTSGDEERGKPNVLGLGGGLRVGVTLRQRAYLGVLGLLHAGTSDAWERTQRHRLHSVGAELGYVARIETITLRPSLRAGAAFVFTTRDVDDYFGSAFAGVGLTVLHPIQHVLLGIDVEARVLERPVNNGDNEYRIATLAGYLTAGYRFY